MPAQLACTPLESLAVFHVRGQDAQAFLHAQFCGDVLALESGRCRFTAWCTPQGRVIATLLLARLDREFQVLLRRDLAQSVRDGLRRYVLRARVEIIAPEPQAEIRGAWGVPGPEGPPDGLAAAWHCAGAGQRLSAALPGRAGLRWLLAGQPESGATRAGAGNDVTAHWQDGDIAAGLAWIGATLSGEFLPQELGLEAVHGLSYSKGCYPGQEIIARVHARGRLKRQLRRFSAAGAAPAPGTRIVHATGSPGGSVITAIAATDGCRGLAVVDIEGARGSELRLELADGARLQFDDAGHG